jgi:hypothetical protein
LPWPMLNHLQTDSKVTPLDTFRFDKNILTCYIATN